MENRDLVPIVFSQLDQPLALLLKIILQPFLFVENRMIVEALPQGFDSFKPLNMYRMLVTVFFSLFNEILYCCIIIVLLSCLEHILLRFFLA